MWYMSETVRLIEHYKSKPELWDPDHPDFRERDKRKSALKSLADEFQVDILEIERKLKSLKTQYARELSKCSTGQRSSWFGFEQLHFLMKSKRNTDDYSTTASENGHFGDNSFLDMKAVDPAIAGDVGSPCSNENNSVIYAEELYPIGESSLVIKSENYGHRTEKGPASKKQKTSHFPEADQFESALSDFNRNLPQEPPRDEFSVFGEHVANKLRSINDPRARAVAQYYISNVLFQTEMTNYNPNVEFSMPQNFTLYKENQG